ncbi:MAG TPA: Fic family protein [Blastocatellia bacterium]|nr:Fic family protein [Blastocatellia bacterium]
MQRPPNRSTPSVLFARGTSEWIKRVSENHKQLTSLKLSSDQKKKLEHWTEAEFIHSTLALEGVNLDSERIAHLVSSEPAVQTDAANGAAALLTSLRRIAALARVQGKSAELTTDLILDIHSAHDAGFRKSQGIITATRKPPPPEHLPALLESACRWYTADSFAELNPIEQAALVLLRLIEIQPFEEKNEQTSLVAASLFTLRSDLPPLVIKAEMNAEYLVALDEATRMNTKPMVELLAWAVADTLEESIKQAS